MLFITLFITLFRFVVVAVAVAAAVAVAVAAAMAVAGPVGLRGHCEQCETPLANRYGQYNDNISTTRDS